MLLGTSPAGAAAARARDFFAGDASAAPHGGPSPLPYKASRPHCIPRRPSSGVQTSPSTPLGAVWNSSPSGEDGPSGGFHHRSASFGGAVTVESGSASSSALAATRSLLRVVASPSAPARTIRGFSAGAAGLPRPGPASAGPAPAADRGLLSELSRDGEGPRSYAEVRDHVLGVVEAAAAEAREAARARAEAPAKSLALLAEAQERYGDVFESPVVRRAFAVAADAHAGQMRRNGEPVVAHVLATAGILAAAGLDERVVAAGLLHDVLDDTPLSEHRLRALLPADGDVVDMVVGVSKLSNISQLHRDAAQALEPADVERLRSMLLAMGDVRVVLIKLADRLHNMRTLGALPAAKQTRLARETLDVFAPLANRLGVWSIKAELEDLSFSYLEPAAHAALAGQVADMELTSVLCAIDAIREALAARGVAIADLSGRPKNLYSIHRKMQAKGRRVEQIYDVRGIRVIVRDEVDCYAALAAVHAMWPPIEGKTKDYIAAPKPNNYRSLHTVVTNDDGSPLEVQIRTVAMHAQAELGLAAHWRYKESVAEATSTRVEQQVAWARFMLSWQRELTGPAAEGAAGVHGSAAAPGACLFPTHSSLCPYLLAAACPAGCPHGAGQPPRAAEADGEPVLVISTDDHHATSIMELPAGTTTTDYLAARFPDPRVRSSLRLLVNDSLGSGLAQPLRMGDHVRVVQLGGRAPPAEVGALGLLAASLHEMSPGMLMRERERLANLFAIGAPATAV